jgi:tetratricopeptide (TPR) repeat protein
LLVQNREFSRALELMNGRQFNMWEGIGKAGIHEVFVDVLLGRGHEHLAAKRYGEALADFRAALSYPARLGTPQPMRGSRYPEIYYWIGIAQEALGQAADARQSFELSVSKGPVELSAPRPAAIEQPQVFYCQALSMRKAGKKAEADELLNRLLAAGRGQLHDKILLDFFTPYGEPDPLSYRMGQAHYAIGLALLGQGEAGQAATEFEEALRLRPAIPSANRHSAGPGDKRAQNAPN